MFDPLLEALKAYGLPGLAIGAAILVLVFFARRAGLAVNGDIARIANLVLGAILASLNNDPEVQKALLAALSSILAGLAYELLKWIGSRFPAFSKG